MTEWMIELNYQQALGQASALETEASRLRSLAVNQMSQALNTLSGSWEGENADQFRRKMGTLAGQINTTAGKLQNAAQTIRRIARNTRDADLRALALAQQRDY